MPSDKIFNGIEEESITFSDNYDGQNLEPTVLPSKLPNILIIIGKSNNCKYEIIKQKENLIFGTQFHPEMTPDGNNLIENFCSL